MILYPAIDLKAGACVRLVRGDMARATIYSDDPAGQARAFAAAGCEWLHVVDLDGAFAGRPVNRDAVADIVAAGAAPVQLGGGIRDMATVEGWLGEGVERVILGTAAVRDPAFVRTACRAFPGRVAVGIDARGGKVAIEGWAEDSDVEARALALGFEDAGAAAVIYTDIARDGTLEGPNLAATEALARALATPLIASGGVGSLADLRALKRLESAGVAGVIVGRALYDGRVEATAALELLAA
ncbi:MAG: 1-(5-phosphoribosyl)-5-[(5-phosphoribosylamino)methylideneamino]imidazole-4-carboxamide isomerase [Proteobacteria bacterium]|nr:1-(5-phosphoribosyl)-5-[(5-phosphoribosylamino)methylideneamino]imidazole-4-carboxamide isomerase [Pseudomonadota bacterium]